MSWPADRRPPMSEYLLLDAHPAITMPSTVIEPSVVRYSRPTFRLAPTKSGANGRTTNDASIGLNTMAGAARKNGASVSRARMSSLLRSLIASANVWSSPNGPVWYGPRRSCMTAWIFRSRKIWARAPLSTRKTASATAITRRSTAQTTGSMPNGPMGIGSASARVAARWQEALAEGMTGERLLEEDPAQVRMTVERDPEHVVRLTLAPVRARPDARERRHPRVHLGTRRAQHREHVGLRAAHECDGAQLRAHVDAGIHGVEVARGERIVSDERRDLDELIAIDVDDHHVVQRRDTGAAAELRAEVRGHPDEVDRRPRRAQYHRRTCFRHA